MANITPFGNNILVKPHAKKQVITPESGTLCEYGDVVAVGSGVTEIKIGDTIGYTPWGINSLQINDEKFYFIPEDQQFLLGTIQMPGELASSVLSPKAV